MEDEKPIVSKDLTQETLLTMVPGQQIMVECEEYRDFDRLGAKCRATSKRFSRELYSRGVKKIQSAKLNENMAIVMAMCL